MGRGQPQRDGAVGSLQDAITLLGKNLLREGPQRGLVLDEKNRFGDTWGLLESGR
ncbi:MAG TPA: hypothetical protein VF908_04355 [Gemmatimonadaceae bacterium]